MNLYADSALLPQGWARDVLIAIDAQGRIESTRSGAQPGSAHRLHGPVVPGMANLHSHAFQRAMAGYAEGRADGADSFWTWRELMYRFAARVTPPQMADLAAYLYVEMLKAGFTSVAEFHYLHRDARGDLYGDPAEMSHRLVAAAGEAGIAITHLPVLYAYAGFGAQAPTEGQRRFVLSASEYETMLTRLRDAHAGTPDVRIGAAFHSLRAVDPALLDAALAAVDRVDATAPIHIHVAEQEREVDDCIAWSGRRPVQWLLDHVPVGPRWCLVHATHMDTHETERLAASGAVAGLCPSTEANLGDGIFPAASYCARGGRYGVGSDSHVSVDVAGELRLLEYGQRLAQRRRGVLEGCYAAAASGGAGALGLDAGRIAPGARADLVVLDGAHRTFWNRGAGQHLEGWVYAGDPGCVRDVMVGGRWRIRDRHHDREEALGHRFRAAQAALLA